MVVGIFIVILHGETVIIDQSLITTTSRLRGINYFITTKPANALLMINYFANIVIRPAYFI